MPWCPQCGAEYREGVSNCAECGVALQAERPELPQPKRRLAFPRFLHRPVRDVRRASGYGVEAARVLRRWPVLLVVPLLIASVDITERAIGARAALRAMSANERDSLENIVRAGDERRSGLRERVWYAAVRSLSLKTALIRFASPLPGLTLTGTAMAWQARLDARRPTERLRTFDLAQQISEIEIVLALQLLVGIPFAAALYAGFYSIASAAARGRTPSLATFWAGIPALFLRFCAYAGVVLVGWLVALAAVEFVLAYPSDRFNLIPAERAWGMVVWAALSLAALTRVAVTADDLSFMSAVRASIRVVARTWAVAVVGLAGLVIAHALITIALSLLAAHVSSAEAIGGGLSPSRIGRGIFDAVIGTWFVLATFIWYRDASARLAQQPFDTSPAPSLESG